MLIHRLLSYANKKSSCNSIHTKGIVNRTTLQHQISYGPISIHHRDVHIQWSLPRYYAKNKKTKKATGSNADPLKEPIEEIYQKKSPVEHILLRPDTYVGTLEKITQDQWVCIGKSIQAKECSYIPALYKIFDEILVNASDQKQRDPKMSEIRVTINVKDNEISIYNDGNGIPVQIHKKEGIYLPELLLGHLLTGSNFNDNVAKITGGRNGYGAKLTNVFSKTFSVDTVDPQRKLRYQQTWTNNMSEKSNPIITKLEENNIKGYTKITFSPDLALFKLKSLRETDLVSIMNRRVYDISAIHSNISVYLNDQLVKRPFNQYIKENLVHFTSDNKRWTVYCGTSDTGQMVQLSFVNGIHTLHGGTHVNYVVDQIVKYVMDRIKKNNRDIKITPNQVKSHLSVIISCLIENPSFNSQTKERLTTKPESFGSKCVLSEKFLKDFVSSSNILQIIQVYARNQQKQALAKNVQRNKEKVFGIPKLDDANEAGGPKSTSCTLIITEGDSAKALAVGGLSIIGRDRYGVFPIQGKLLNVRDASSKKVVENKEIKDLIRVIGLNPHKTYKEWDKDSKTLRYGKVMLMADQDHDGSHIKGLFINFIHHFWPELLKRRGFLYEFITPILKATKGNKVHSFFTIQEYEQWKGKLDPNELKTWGIKYYKGLGTNTTLEAKKYFKDLKKHVVEFVFNEGDEELIDMAFNKKLSNLRREWLLTYNDKDHVNTSKGVLSIHDFINKELISFSFFDNVRSIPSIVDGLKPSQRKVLYACFKRNLVNEIKVAQLAGYVSEQASYHHGEVSLHGTIVNMAQTYVGSNNVPLLYPSGQFGTRLQGGKDAASARYIYTRLSHITRLIFHPLDDHLLEYLDDDGFSIEPEYYVPIIPFVLVNGSEGLGTGWSTSIPLFNPIAIIDNLLKKMAGEKMKEMIPYYRGFKGKISKLEPTRFISQGKISNVDGKIHITELPVGKWTNDYKVFLETIIKEQGIIKEFSEHHTDETVHFIITPTDESTADLPEERLLQLFKLEEGILSSNMCSFDPTRTLKKYACPLEIIDEFYDVRLRFYEKRRQWLIQDKETTVKKLANQMRFIESFMNGDIKVFNTPKTQVIQQLKEKGFDTFGSSDYGYLLNTSISNLSLENVEYIQSQLKKNEESLKALLGNTPEMLWKEDLKVLRVELVKMFESKKK